MGVILFMLNVAFPPYIGDFEVVKLKNQATGWDILILSIPKCLFCKIVVYLNFWFKFFPELFRFGTKCLKLAGN